MPSTTASGATRAVPSDTPSRVDPADVPALRIDVPRLMLAGTALWAVAMVASLLLPVLHSDDHDWWPIACAAGVVLGLLGHVVSRRAAVRRRADG